MATFDDRHPHLPSTVSSAAALEVREILATRGEERVRKLLACDRIQTVVALMPPEELFFTLREADEENLPALLYAAQPSQLQFLFDLELWRKDRFKDDQVLPWLRRLVDCGPDALDRWVRGVDGETWSLLLGAVARVRVREEESDPFQEEDGKAPFTLDGVHYVFASEEAQPVLREFLLRMQEQGGSSYREVLEALSGSGDAEVEERAYEEKVRRLAVRGFPAWEEAYEVYARLAATDPDELPTRPGAGSVPSDEGPMVAPMYPIAASGTAPDLLAQSLRRLKGGPQTEAFHAELAYLTNKVVVADGLDVGELDSFDRALRKVAAYTSIGLELLCGPDDERAAQVLSTRWLQHLFRAGWTRVRAAQLTARHFLDKDWPSGRMERLLFLDSPLPETLDGLLRRHPLCYVGDAEPPPLREFRTLREVQLAEKAVRKSELLGRYLLSVINFQLNDLRNASTHLAIENLKGSTVFLTALLNSALGRDFRFAPVDRENARKGLALVWEADRPPRRVKPGLVESAVEWSKTIAPALQEEEVLLREFVGDAFGLLEEEFGHLAEDETPDPRFTKGLWIE